MTKDKNIGVSPTFGKQVLAAVLRFFNPSYSHCEKCGMPWNHCKSKSVYTDERSGTFATCQECWDNSTLEQIKEYYTNVYIKQKASIAGTNYQMEHSLEHLLKCVEQEYARTHGS